MDVSNRLALLTLDEKTNFSNWKFRIKILLEEKGIKGELKGIEDKDDAKAKSIIVQCLSDRYLETVKKCKSSEDMIKQLENMFQRKSVFNKLYLKKRLLTLKKTQEMQDHFLKFDSLVADLEGAGCKLDQSDIISHLLLTLPDEYETVITTLETMVDEKVLTLDFVKSRLLDAELKIKGKELSQSSVDTCMFACYKCGKKGHKAYQCRTNNNNNSIDRGMRRSRGRGAFRSRGRFNRSSAHMTQGDENLFVALSMDGSITETDNLVFIVDSGATHHFVQQKYERSMTDIEELESEIKIKIANGHTLVAKKKGYMKVLYKNEPLTIEALIVPGLTHNLLSVHKLMERNITVVFRHGELKIHTKTKTYVGEKCGKLYILKVELPKSEYCHSTSMENNLDIWHKRLGHANRKSLALMNLPYSNKVCDTCMKNKSTRLPFNTITRRQSHSIGELVHSDVAGPTRVPTNQGHRYFQTIIDDYSHFTQTYLLMNKNEATNNIIKYIKAIETEKEIKVKKIRTDNGGEYTSIYF